MKRLLHVFLTAGPLLAGCSTTDFQTLGLDISSAHSSIVVGDTLTMSVVRRDGSVPDNSEVEWLSSNTAVATVDGNGFVTGTGAGWAQIVASTKDFTVAFPLRVWSLAPPFVSLAMGADHSCALTEDGQAWCWGSNVYGQLGAGAPDACSFGSLGTYACSKGALPVETELRFTALAVGAYHSCGLSVSGTVYCWGLNDQGQLGDGGTTDRVGLEPVSGDHVFKSLSSNATSRRTCGIAQDDALWCWGNDHLGDTATAPVPEAPEHGFRRVATAVDHTCGLTLAGLTLCWGWNSAGQLGVEPASTTCQVQGAPAACSTEPQEVASEPSFTQLVVDWSFSCGLADDGQAYCWGENGDGQLGDGTREARWQAGPVTGGHTFSMLSTGPDHTCGLESPGLLFCWGRDAAAFGTGGDPVVTDEPLPGAPDLTFSRLAVGFDHTCGISDTGVTWCWGGDGYGQLGNGINNILTMLTTPVRVVFRDDQP